MENRTFEESKIALNNLKIKDIFFKQDEIIEINPIKRTLQLQHQNDRT